MIRLLIAVALLQSAVFGKHLHHEKYYQQVFCKRFHGGMEVRLPDDARVDCLTDQYAIEVDFANKVFEGIGQSLYYSMKTGKKPGVVVITEHPGKDRINVRRLIDVAKKYEITVWSIDPEGRIKRER
jgi:hypothetical protein